MAVNMVHTNGIRCGNTKAHGHKLHAYHATIAEVRECFLWTEYEEKCEREAEAYADSEPEYIEEDPDVYFDLYLERRAEQGSWFGFGD